MRYIIHPGYVLSNVDDQSHFISAERLIALYKVNPKQCILASSDLHGYNSAELIHLYPLYDGNYELPKLHKDLD